MKCFKTNKINKYFRVFTEIRKKNPIICIALAVQLNSLSIYIYTCIWIKYLLSQITVLHNVH